MKATPPSSQRNHPDSEPMSKQCPYCGSSNPWQIVGYIHPKTGAQKETNGCLAGVVIFLVLFVLVGMLLYYLFNGPSSEGYVGDGIAFLGGLIAFVGAVISIPVYSKLRENWLRKTCFIVHRCWCPQCKNEWLATLEPPEQRQP